MGALFFGIVALVSGLLGRAAWDGGDVIDCIVALGLWFVCLFCAYACVGQLIIIFFL